MTEDSKVRLKRLTLMAIDRYENGEGFTNQEVEAYFGCLRTSFGETEASGFLNLVLHTIKAKQQSGLLKCVDKSGWPI